MGKSLLIIDDEKKHRGLLARILDLEGYTVFQADNGKEGLKILSQEDILVVISDVKLPDINGLELVSQIKEKKPFVEVIHLTAYGTIQDGVLAIKNGAFDYITKGDDNDKILPLLARAVEKAQLQMKVNHLENKISKKLGFDSIMGESKAIQACIHLAKRVSETNATVLLLGETGTGKEVFSQAIHYHSLRKHQNFVAVNCTAFGKDLLESELFGHKAGAFTGALKDKKGLFEEADKGTLFLDEIGEMNIDLQAKLLRVLETGQFIKVGDTKTLNIDVRIIAATNRKLEDQIEKGSFREDLFYRLSGFQIKLPSLNERKEDIIPLAQFFLKDFALKSKKSIQEMDSGFKTRLENHKWKGNIRELRNLIERSVILSDSSILRADTLPFDFYSETESPLSNLSLANMERLHIQKILDYAQGNKTEAARILDIGLTTLYRKIEEYKLG